MSQVHSQEEQEGAGGQWPSGAGHRGPSCRGVSADLLLWGHGSFRRALNGGTGRSDEETEVQREQQLSVR